MGLDFTVVKLLPKFKTTIFFTLGNIFKLFFKLQNSVVMVA